MNNFNNHHEQFQPPTNTGTGGMANAPTGPSEQFQPPPTSTGTGGMVNMGPSQLPTMVPTGALTWSRVDALPTMRPLTGSSQQMPTMVPTGALTWTRVDALPTMNPANTVPMGQNVPPTIQTTTPMNPSNTMHMGQMPLMQTTAPMNPSNTVHMGQMPTGVNNVPHPQDILTDGSYAMSFINNTVSENGIIPPIKLMVKTIGSVRYQNTGNGVNPVINCILCNGNDETVEISAWDSRAIIISQMRTGQLYTFSNCRALSPREQTNCFFRIGFNINSRIEPNPLISEASVVPNWPHQQTTYPPISSTYQQQPIYPPMSAAYQQQPQPSVPAVYQQQPQPSVPAAYQQQPQHSVPVAYQQQQPQLFMPAAYQQQPQSVPVPTQQPRQTNCGEAAQPSQQQPNQPATMAPVQATTHHIQTPLPIHPDGAFQPIQSGVGPANVVQPIQSGVSPANVVQPIQSGGGPANNVGENEAPETYASVVAQRGGGVRNHPYAHTGDAAAGPSSRPRRAAAQPVRQLMTRPIDECFVIESSTPMRNALRNTRGEICEIRFLPLEDCERPDLLLETLIQHMLDRVLQGHPPPLLVGLQLHPPSFERPFVVRLRPPEQNNAAVLAAAVERLNDQSAAEIDFLSGTTLTKVLAVWPLNAVRSEDGRGACDLNEEHYVSHNVQSLVRVQNPNDRLCLARAILLGMHDRKCRTPEGGGRAAFKTYASHQHLHGAEARNLLRRVGIPRNKRMYTLEDVDRIQLWLNEKHGEGQIRIVVFEKESEYRIAYKGQGRAAQFNLCLLLEREHFNYIGRIEQLFKVQQYCIDCERRADRLYHPSGCRVVCRLCLRFGPEYPCRAEQLANGYSSTRLCTDCGFIFPNDDCFNFHRANRAPNPVEDGRSRRTHRPICEWRRICRFCGNIAYLGSHRCPRQGRWANNANCFRCNGPHTRDQPCFIQPIGGAPQVPPPIQAMSIGTPPQQQQQQQQQQEEDQASTLTNDDDEDDVDELPLRLCFFDAETSQDQPLQLRTQVVQKHVPLLIVAEVICERCIRAGISIHDGIGRRAPDCVCGSSRGQRMRTWSTPPFVNDPPPGAPTYNPRRFYFHSFDNEALDPVDEFLDFLTKKGSKKVLTLCLAHNGGKYDFHLILEALHRRSTPPKRLCTTGLKIYSMRLFGTNQRRVTFKDSLNYFFCELDALPKTFDLPTTLATTKPFFPYLFIRRENLHRRLQGLPEIEHYSPDTMKPEKREKFLKWHADASPQATFQLREQLILYCVNDVAILRESVIRFRHLIAEQTQGLDPFVVASTAAGLALATMRRCFLPPNRLVHSPEGGYLRGRRASAESQKYIRYFELSHPGAQVQCASWAIGEAHIEDSGYRVDGLWQRVPPEKSLAIEWLGCYYHGCIDCFPERQQKLAAGRTAEHLYERTMFRLWELEHLYGYELHVVWACKWQQKLRRDPSLKQFYDTIFVPGPMDPRKHALSGGRTEPFKLYHRCGPDEEILAIDVVSLYPFVMKAYPFPVGNPRVFTRETLLCPPVAPLPWTQPSENVFKGILYIRVLPPFKLRIPLLGYHTQDGRFTFPLCARCADLRQQRPCRHSAAQRSWASGYTHVELNKALELGYRVLDLFEVWHYDEWDDTLFRSYVNTFVELKQQSSGWPQGCDTPEQRQAYLDDFERTEGIRLDPAKISPNPGLRLVAKTLLNSLWGKLAQRVGRTEIRYTRSPAEFHTLMDDQTLDKLDFCHVSPHMDRCVVRKRPEFSLAPSTNCLPIAIFVTSYARLHLYSYMEKVLALGAELLYGDTDSLYYVHKIGTPCVSEGEALGQMKRELADRRIFEFVAGGPKNYGIRHAKQGTEDEDERANLKIRSFRLSYATHQLLNFNTMKELTLANYNIDGAPDDLVGDPDGVYVFGGGGRTIRVNFPQIGRTEQADLYTHTAQKDYRPYYAKGRVRPGMQTLPFGYRQQ